MSRQTLTADNTSMERQKSMTPEPKKQFIQVQKTGDNPSQRRSSYFTMAHLYLKPASFVRERSYSVSEVDLEKNRKTSEKWFKPLSQTRVVRARTLVQRQWSRSWEEQENIGKVIRTFYWFALACFCDLRWEKNSVRVCDLILFYRKWCG